MSEMFARTLLDDADHANDDDDSAVEEEANFERMLAEAMEDNYDTDVANDINCGDLVMKLSQMCGEEGVDPEACACFSSVVARLCMGETADGVEDASALRTFLKSVCAVLEASLKCPCDVSGDPAAEPALNIVRVTLLRTARFCMVRGCMNIEYARRKTSIESEPRELCAIMCEEACMQERMHCYRVAEEMHYNFVEGLQSLKNLSSAPDHELIATLNSGRANVACAFASVAFASACDGQRLRAGNLIAARLFGGSRYNYGESCKGKARCVFNAHGASELAEPPPPWPLLACAFRLF